MKRFVVLGLAAVGCVALLGADEAAKDLSVPEETPVIDTYEVMEFMMDPAYEALKDALVTEPEGRRGWRAVYVASYTVAEQANLLFSRNDEEYMLTPEWDQMSADMRQKAAAIGDTVREQDYSKAKDAYLGLIQSCNACHQATDPDNAPEVKPWDE